MDDEPTIISDCLGGRREAYRALVDRHAPAVRSFLARKLGDLDRAEEASQESFVRAYLGLRGLRGGFVGWVLGIAARVAMEFQRARARSGPGVDGLELAETPVPDSKDEVTRAVQRLAEPYREAVVLRYWAGLRCEEVAEVQGVSLGTLTKRLCRAHALLRESLGEGPRTREVDHELRRVP